MEDHNRSRHQAVSGQPVGMSAVCRRMMKCFSLILGARNTSAAGTRFLKRDDALIRSLTARHFPDGFTILAADGGWFDPARKAFVEEASRQILVCSRKQASIRAWCADLAHALNQKELLVVELGIARTFRYRKNSLPQR
jgi:hypothetical protein